MTIQLSAVLDLKDNFSAQMKAAGAGATDAFSKITAGAKAIGPAVSGGFQVLEGNYKSLGTMFSSIPGPVGEIAGAVGSFIGEATAKTAELISQTFKLQRATGMTAEEASKLIAVNKAMGISGDQTVSTFGKFARAIGGAMDAEGAFATAGKGLPKLLEELGIKATDASGKVLPLNTLLPQIADAFKRLGPGAESTALAMKVFGRTGTELLPMLLGGSEGIKRLGEEATATGLILTQDLINAQMKTVIASREMNAQMEGLQIMIGAKVIPEIARYSTGLATLTGFVSRTTNSSGLLKLGIDAVSKAFNPLGVILDAINPKMDTTVKAIEAETVALKDGEVWWNGLIVNVKELKKGTEGLIAPFKEYTAETQDALEWNNKMAAAAGYTATQILQLKEAGAQAAVTQKELGTRTAELGGYLTASLAPLTEAAQAEELYKLATGQTTLAKFGEEQATKALSAARAAGHITMETEVATLLKLRNGTISTADAYIVAGKSGVPFEKQNDATGASLGRLNGKLKDTDGNIDTSSGKWRGFTGDVRDAMGAILRVPSKEVTVEAHVYGTNATQDLKFMIDGVPSKSVSVTANVSGAGAAQDLKNRIDALSSKSITVTTYYNTVNGTFGGCFIAGTMVHTPEGEAAIESLRIGDVVSSYNHAQGLVIPHVVLKTFHHERKPTWELLLKNGRTIVTTQEHPFYSLDAHDYIKAGDLTPGVHLLRSDGAPIMVEWVGGGDPADVYNIEVAECHNYFANDILVHNKICFAAGTLIMTPDGPLAIEYLRIGSHVYCYDHELSELVIQHVTRTYEHADKPTWFVRVGAQVIHCTPEHPFWVTEQQAYVPARDLKPGTHALGMLGEQGEISPGAAGVPETVYNIEVPTYHNYYAYGYLVHNDSEQHQARMMGGGGSPITVNQQFGDGGLAMRQTAMLLQNAMKKAARESLLRASIGS